MQHSDNGASQRPRQESPSALGLADTDPDQFFSGMALLAWQELRHGRLVGLASVRLGGIALTIHDVAVYARQDDEPPRAKLPARLTLAPDGTPRRYESGKLFTKPTMEWGRPRWADSFSRAVLRLLKRHHPGVVRP
jgi:hypothetical protein